MRTILRAALLAAVLALALLPGAASAGGGGGAPCTALKSPPPPGLVLIRDSCFTPTDLRVATGQAVTWKLRSGFPHTVTAFDQAFDSKDVKSLYTLRFNHPGTYRYACAYHPWMIGKVTVEGASAGGTDAVSVLTVESSANDPATLLAEAEHRLATAITAAVRQQDRETVPPEASASGVSGMALGGAWAGAAVIAGLVAVVLRRRAPGVD